MKNIPKLLIFSIIFLFAGLNAQEDINFRLKHSASFAFKDSIPLIRVHVKDLENNVNIEGLDSFICNGNTVKAQNIQTVVKSFNNTDVKYRLSFQEISRDQLKSYQFLVDEWAKRTGEKVGIYVHGAIFSINKSRIDNREYFITIDTVLEKNDASELLAK